MEAPLLFLWFLWFLWFLGFIGFLWFLGLLEHLAFSMASRASRASRASSFSKLPAPYLFSTYLCSVARTAPTPAYSSRTMPSICSPKPAS